MAIVWRIAALATLSIAIGWPACAATDWSHARAVTVTAADYKFMPSNLVLRHGAIYRLHVVNRGKELHEFHSAEFFKAATLRDPAVLNAEKNEVVVEPGKAKDVYLVAPPAGQYPFFCPDHDWAGMTGEITVK
jgi:uncharacterized cupredoxin-like copper-binding protein